MNKFICLMIALLSSTSSLICSTKNGYDFENDLKTAYSETLKSCQKAVNKYQLSCYRADGCMKNHISDVEIYCKSFSKCNIDQARKLCHQVTYDLLDELNNNQHLRPYLKNYPLGYKDIHLNISFWNLEKRLSAPFVGMLNLHTGKVQYDEYDKLSEHFHPLHTENFLDENI